MALRDSGGVEVENDLDTWCVVHVLIVYRSTQATTNLVVEDFRQCIECTRYVLSFRLRLKRAVTKLSDSDEFGGLLLITRRSAAG